MEHQTKLPPRAPQWTDTHPLGQNAALFAELNRRRSVDRWTWYAIAAVVGMIIWAVL